MFSNVHFRLNIATYIAFAVPTKTKHFKKCIYSKKFKYLFLGKLNSKVPVITLLNLTCMNPDSEPPRDFVYA